MRSGLYPYGEVLVPALRDGVNKVCKILKLFMSLYQLVRVARESSRELFIKYMYIGVELKFSLCEGRKTKGPRTKTSEQKTQPTYGVKFRIRSRATLMRGERYAVFQKIFKILKLYILKSTICYCHIV